MHGHKQTQTHYTLAFLDIKQVFSTCTALYTVLNTIEEIVFVCNYYMCGKCLGLLTCACVIYVCHMIKAKGVDSWLIVNLTWTKAIVPVLTPAYMAVSATVGRMH